MVTHQSLRSDGRMPSLTTAMEGFVQVTAELQGAEMLDVLAAIDAAEGKS